MNEKKRQNVFLRLMCAGLLLTSLNVTAQSEAKNSSPFRNHTSISEYIAYKADGSIIVSGHRGGREKGYPENSLEGFKNIIGRMTAIFEIDPRLTKDSVIVLMHDATLDRTTSGKGKLSDFTWNELQQIRLKDSEGNVTSCKIPTLEEVILWSKGKTIVNLDKKDVPMEQIADLIRKLDAADYVMLTVHTGAQARYYYDRFPEILLSVFARNWKEYEDIAISGVPWKNMIAYVGPSINDENRKIVDLLHSHGVRCMISVAPTHDKLASAADRHSKYLMEIATHPDIIESDIPTEVNDALKAQAK